ncbi:MAG: hypothetical protein J6D21_03610 [Clostridia bacterium]|nr:hypothetical protein [Clostridia bacterium]
MKRIVQILLCTLLSTSMLFCACSTDMYIPTENAEYELVYEWGALVLKENGKAVERYKACDVFAISGGSMLDSATVQGKKAVRAFFKEMFSDGIPMTLVTGEDIPKYDFITMEAYGLACEDVDPDALVYTIDTEGLQAIFIMPIEQTPEESKPFFFVDRYGNYYRADSTVLSGRELRFYIVSNHSNALIVHEKN